MKTRASSNIAVLAWSGGKDSALALEALQKEKRIRITRLLTTITKDYDSMITRDKNT
jgi:diphthamide synthase (EF-2-diphthine--ammonia ligase)